MQELYLIHGEMCIEDRGAAGGEPPESQRHAIVLHHLCDLPVEEVAALPGVPLGTVKARLSRGRAALAAALSDAKESHRG